MKKVDLLIIGGGPAGLSAALSAWENGIKDILIVERDKEPGGILPQCIHSGFGLHIFGEDLTGPEYAERFINLLKKTDTKYLLDTMVLNISKDRIITVINKIDGLVDIETKAVILAMGCRERSRGALNIPGTRPSGIFSAGTAQRFVNLEGYMPGKKIVILGSGDIGLIMARRMSLEGAKVEMVCEIMPYPGGLTRNIVQCLYDYDIPLMLEHTITQIHGNERLTGVTISDKTYTHSEFIECDTLLLSVGLIPENELSKQAGIEIDPMTTGPYVDDMMQTSINGIFACGNVVHVHDLVDFVTEQSQLAGACAAKYILDKDTCESNDVTKVRAGNGIRYVIPQTVNLKRIKKDLKLLFRVTDIMNNVKFLIENEGRSIHTYKKSRVAPGEMESVKISKEMLKKITSNSEITIRIEGAKK